MVLSDSCGPRQGKESWDTNVSELKGMLLMTPKKSTLEERRRQSDYAFKFCGFSLVSMQASLDRFRSAWFV